ncbi:N-formylglutamate amidohydrolase [Geminicoccus roseus]|uniref:N-formylglutamate amidohydrolase n=1 Tax=Geminicoccus roseus TaxID=404900 RepID=UPI0005542764|nr:N-formylglutamate amidohydrolase [Geminicoccus roseus]
MTDPFVLVRPAGPALPVLISSPHSGRHYPVEERLRLGLAEDMLPVLNDGPVHELFAPGVQSGATLLRARWSRAWIDLNRDPQELDEAAISGIPSGQRPRRSLRVQAGLGVVPTRLGERRVHQRRLAHAEIAQRIETVHLPYHLALAAECRRLSGMFGQVLLLDCHSMPAPGAGLPGMADVVLGDRYGRSCGAELVAEAERVLRGGGLSVARNRPFAGGWITERHGRPARRVHALQIELRRDLFFPHSPANQVSREHLPGLARLLVERLGALLLANGAGEALLAAE